jgi:hypothetical protein
MSKIYEILITFILFRPFCKKNDFLKIGLNIAIFWKTLTGHNSEAVGPFELKFVVVVYFDKSYPTNLLNLTKS